MTRTGKRRPAHQRGMGRREFLLRAMAGGAAFAMPTIIPSSALGLGGRKAPGERIVIAGIGIGRRGRNLIDFLLPEGGVQIVADADVRRERRDVERREPRRRASRDGIARMGERFGARERGD